MGLTQLRSPNWLDGWDRLEGRAQIRVSANDSNINWHFIREHLQEAEILWSGDHFGRPELLDAEPDSPVRGVLVKDWAS